MFQKVSPVLKKFARGWWWHYQEMGVQEAWCQFFFWIWQHFFILNLKILTIWISSISRCHLKDFFTKISKQALLFEICNWVRSCQQIGGTFCIRAPWSQNKLGSQFKFRYLFKNLICAMPIRIINRNNIIHVWFKVVWHNFNIFRLFSSLWMDY